MTAQAAKPKKKFEVPHILLIIAGIACFACLLTYIAPAGVFDLDANGNAIAGTYHTVVPISPTLPTSAFPFGIHTFVHYAYVSISALQIRSSVPFFEIPHICVNIQYLVFSF